jgi:hypothetical protein
MAACEKSWSKEYGINKRDMHNLQPYYLAYLKATKDNIEIRSNHNFINWIKDKHRKFQHEGNDKKSGDYSSNFLCWLNDI